MLDEQTDTLLAGEIAIQSGMRSWSCLQMNGGRSGRPF